MTMSDPIADMLTRIRNANTAKHDTVDVPASKMKLAIADILVEEGYVKKYEVIEDGGFQTIRISLKYNNNKSERIISGIKKISKPGLRILRWQGRYAEGTWRSWYRYRIHKPGCYHR